MSLVFGSRLRRFLVAGSLLLLAACGGDVESPEARLKAEIAKVVEFVENGEPRQAGDVLHPDYRDDRHPDKRSAIASLFWYTRQHSNVHLFTLVRDVDVDVESGTARTTVFVAMAGVPIESVETIVSVQADLYRFDVDWHLHEDDWRATSSRWERADLSVL